MAKRHDLIITISESGEITVQAEGIDGPQCVKETDFLTEDDEIISQEFTSEYYKQDSEEVTVNQKS